MGSRDIINTLRDSGKLSGIIFIEDGKMPLSFSRATDSASRRKP